MQQINRISDRNFTNDDENYVSQYSQDSNNQNKNVSQYSRSNVSQYSRDSEPQRQFEREYPHSPNGFYPVSQYSRGRGEGHPGSPFSHGRSSGKIRHHVNNQSPGRYQNRPNISPASLAGAVHFVDQNPHNKQINYFPTVRTEYDPIMEELKFNPNSNPCLLMALELYSVDISNGLDTLNKFKTLSARLEQPIDRQIVDEGQSKAAALSNKFANKRKASQKKDNVLTVRELAEKFKTQKITILTMMKSQKSNTPLPFFSPKKFDGGLDTETDQMSIPSAVQINLTRQFNREYIPTPQERLELLAQLKMSKVMGQYSTVELEEAEAALAAENSEDTGLFSIDQEKKELKRIFRITCGYLMKHAAKDADMESLPLRKADSSFDWETEYVLNAKHNESIKVCSENFKNLIEIHRAPMNYPFKAGYLVQKYEREVLRYEWICLLFNSTIETKTKVSDFKLTVLATKLEYAFSRDEKYLEHLYKNMSHNLGTHKFDYYKSSLQLPIPTHNRDQQTPTIRGIIKKVQFTDLEDDNSFIDNDERTDSETTYFATDNDGISHQVFMVSQAPLSKNPDGVAIAEKRTESTTKRQKSTVHYVKEKPKKGQKEEEEESEVETPQVDKKRKRDVDSDPDSEYEEAPKKIKTNPARNTRSSTTRKGTNAQTSQLLRKIEELTKTVDTIKQAHTEKETNETYGGSRRRNSYQNESQPYGKPPSDACPMMVQGKWCNDERCKKNHGKFVRKDANGRDRIYCDSHRENTPCPHLWSARGCYYNHHIKNARVIGNRS